jgi:hypothetical protein
MNSNLLNLKNQKEELQKLAQSEDFSGVNKKLTNLFIE